MKFENIFVSKSKTHIAAVYAANVSGKKKESVFTTPLIPVQLKHEVIIQRKVYIFLLLNNTYANTYHTKSFTRAGEEVRKSTNLF